MKKLFWIVLTLLIFSVNLTSNIQAEDKYPMNSNNYEVAYINDDGTFSMVAEYGTFDEAKAKMKELGGDHVVRHNKSLSPTKIIAMNSGIAYSYPRTGATLNIYEHVSIRDIYHKQTYVARHYEMNYIETERYLGNGTGMIEVNVNGFHGYTDLEYTDLVPSKYIRNKITITLGGNNSYTNESPFNIICSQNYYEIVQNGNYKDVVYHIFYGYPSGLNAIEETIAIGPATDNMQTGVKYYSYSGTELYTNDTFTEGKITYYNYYQYLPLRSKTNISADVLNNFISKYSGSVMNGTGQNFIDAQNKYGMNALLLFSMAVHESGGGTSAYATKRNNLFGWNAFDADPSQASSFNSIADCVNEQAGINLRGYVDITDGRFFSSSLGNKGSGLNVKYASDPYWGMEIASIAYQIDKLSKDKDGTLSDYNYYSLSRIDTFDAEIKSQANSSSDTLYTTAYGPSYQKDFIVITLAKDGEYTKIQSTNPIDSNGNIKTHKTPITVGTTNPIEYGEYDFNKSVGYIKTSSLTTINKEVKEETNNNYVNDLTLFFTIDSNLMQDGYLNMSGNTFLKGIDATDLSKISGYINTVKMSDNSVVSTTPLVFKEQDGISFNDGHTYKYVGFDANISLNELPEDEYYFTLTVNNNGHTATKTIHVIDKDRRYSNYSNDGVNYHLQINGLYAYQLNLSVERNPDVIDYNEINGISLRRSLFSLDSFSLDKNGNVLLSGQALIYYTNYNDLSQIKTTIYAVKNSDNWAEINCENYQGPINFTEIFKSSYDLTNIDFKGSGNFANLEPGTYRLIARIQNGSAIDYIEVNNLNEIEISPIQINNKTYSFYSEGTRARMLMKVE